MDLERVTPRAPEDRELDTLFQFLNTQLRQQHDWSITQEYPTALSENNMHNMSIVVNENNTIVSHALLKPQICKTPYAVFSLGAIGSVVTAPEYRNQGLSKKNILHCLDYAKKQDCDLAILWTDQHDFYRKFGFELAGFEHTFLVDTIPVLKNSKNKFIKGNKIDPQALLRLYNLHTVNSVRTAEDIRKFLNIPNSRVFSLWSPSNQLLAYAIEGKGADLHSYIHEWGGSVDDIQDLLHHMMTSEQMSFTFMCPHHSVNLRNRMSGLSSHENTGYLGMIKILNFEQVLQKIKNAFRAEGYEQIVLEKNNGQIIFGYGSDIYTLNNENDLVKILFGPTQIDELAFIKAETRKILSHLLPLPLWVWGWDSV